MKFPEIGNVLDGNAVSREVEPAVEEHGAVACGEDETVAIEPTRGVGIEVHAFAEEDGSDFRAAEWEAKVAGVAGVDGVHGEASGFGGGGG